MAPSVNAGAGTTTANFLKLGSGARPLGMGGAFLAVADDTNALLWNPAGLGRLARPELAFMYNPLVEFMGYHVLAYGQPVPELRGGVGAALQYFSSGTVAGYDANDQPLAAFTNEDWMGTIAYGTTMGAGAVGASAHVLVKRLYDVTAAGLLADVGGQFEVTDRVRIGAAVKHLGTGLQFVQDRAPFPLTIQLGAAYLADIGPRRLTIALDGEWSADSAYRVRAGAEFDLWPWLRARGGYGYGPGDQGLQAGAEIGVPAFHLDYAFVPAGLLGSTHRLSVTLPFDAAALPPGASGNLDAACETARLAHLQGDYVEAHRLYRGVLALRPDHAAADRGLKAVEIEVALASSFDAARESIARHAERAKAALASRDVVTAQSIVEALNALTPLLAAPASQPPASATRLHALEQLRLATGAYRRQDFATAISLLSRATALEPGLVEAEALLLVSKEKSDALATAEARAEQDRRDREAARQRLEEAHRLFQKGGQALDAGEVPEAIKALEQSLALDPLHKGAQDLLAKAKARAAFRTALAKAREAEDQELWEAALTQYDLALKMNPGHADTRAALDRVRARLKALNEERAEGLYADGLKAYGKGQLEDAIAAWTKALELNPSHKKARQSLDRVKLERQP